jgi:integrase
MLTYLRRFNELLFCNSLRVREGGRCNGVFHRYDAFLRARARGMDHPIEILTVDELSRLLRHATAELVSYLAIGAFAGLRRAELERLDWKEIDLDDGLIEIPASKAKSAQRRHVHILPNLSAWLRSYAKPSGKVTPTNYKKLLKKARDAAGITQWPNNGLRHSYASYHLAQFKSADSLALELGHSGTDIIFRHYREVVKPADAQRYWQILPADRNAKVVKFPKAAVRLRSENAPRHSLEVRERRQ